MSGSSSSGKIGAVIMSALLAVTMAIRREGCHLSANAGKAGKEILIEEKNIVPHSIPVTPVTEEVPRIHDLPHVEDNTNTEQVTKENTETNNDAIDKLKGTIEDQARDQAIDQGEDQLKELAAPDSTKR